MVKIPKGFISPTISDFYEQGETTMAKHHVNQATVEMWLEKYDRKTVTRMVANAEATAIGDYEYDADGNVVALSFPADADGPAWSWRRPAAT
jgi:hypothetical protein